MGVENFLLSRLVERSRSHGEVSPKLFAEESLPYRLQSALYSRQKNWVPGEKKALSRA